MLVPDIRVSKDVSVCFSLAADRPAGIGVA